MTRQRTHKTADQAADLFAFAGFGGAATLKARRATAKRSGALVLVAGLCAALGAPVIAPAFGPAFAQTPAIEIAPAPVAPPVQVIVPQVARHHSIRHAPVYVSSVDANVKINDQVATTSITMAMTNPGGSQAEAQVVIPVPEGVAVRSIQYDGVGNEPNAELLPREKAREIYDAIVRSMRDPALVEFVGYNLIKTSAFPIAPGATQKITITYEQIVPANTGRVEYTLPRAQADTVSAAPWTINVEVNSSRPIALLHSSSHAINVEKPSANRCVVRVPQGQGSGAFRLTYAAEPTDPNELAYSLLTYPDALLNQAATVKPGENAITTTPAATGGGYFMLVVAPPANVRNTEQRARELVLVLDRSGSMRGEKWNQAQAAAIQVIHGLNEGELFNIIDYSDSIASYAAAPVVKDSKTAKDAREYIQGLAPSGGTNIHDALLEAVRPAPSTGALPMVLFLTDGLPTIGERNEARIREAVKAANTSNRRIFTFGVGHDVNFPLISSIATASRGTTTVVDPSEDVEMKVSQVFNRLTGPLVTEPVLSAANADGEVSTRLIRELMPPTLPDVFEGDQIIVLGQYVGNEAFKVRISGNFAGKERTWEIPVDPAAASLRNGFVPRLWANRKVGLLADQARQMQADPSINTNDPRLKEIVEEIVALSTRFGVLSEYTAFLAREDSAPNFDLGVAMREAEDNIGRMAGGMRSGKAGAAQQIDQERKQMASVAPAAAPVWRDLDNNEVRTANVTNLGANTYFKRGNVWIDSRVMLENQNAVMAEAPKPDQTIAFGSPEYAELANILAQRDEQAMLAQEGDILLKLDDRVILVLAPTDDPETATR
jgi:Ca-activated chloride channel family protein